MRKERGEASHQRQPLAFFSSHFVELNEMLHWNFINFFGNKLNYEESGGGEGLRRSWQTGRRGGTEAQLADWASGRD